LSVVDDPVSDAVCRSGAVVGVVVVVTTSNEIAEPVVLLPAVSVIVGVMV
jgi:hypothetical protein